MPPAEGTPPTGGSGSSRLTIQPSLPKADLSSDRMLLTLPRDAEGRPLLGRIPIICRLGAGGMGAVYYAVHPRLQVEAAVKILPHHLVEQDPKLVDRFIGEARMAAALSSEHIVRVLDVDQEGDTHFIVMEYIPGESAGALLKRRRTEGGAGLEPAEALQIVAAAARGLAAAHERGIVHRDIKPDNILIPRGQLGRAKLADLGLAKPDGASHTLGTASHVAMGTPGYMAPEQIEDAKLAGMPADIFSMGATLYALLSGRAPFWGTSLGVILRDTAAKEPEPLPDRIDPAIRALVMKCLAKDPKARFANGVELLAALNALAPSPSTASGPTLIAARDLQVTPPPPPPVRGGGIGRVLGLVAAGLLLLVAAGAMLWMQRIQAKAEWAQFQAEAAAAADPLDRLGRVLAYSGSRDAAEWNRLLADTDAAAWARVSATERPIADRIADLERYTGIHSGSPNAPEAAAILSDLRRRSGEFRDAMARAEAARTGKRWAEAREAAVAAGRAVPGDPAVEALLRRIEGEEREGRVGGEIAAGIAALGRKEYAEAVKRFEAALAVAPGSLEALRGRGTAHLELQKYDAAIADLTAALTLGPGDAFALRDRGRARFYKGLLDGALEDLREAAKRNPSDAVTHNAIGAVLQARGDHDGAMAAFGESIRLDPRFLKPRVNRAKSWEARGDLARAIEDYGEAIRLQPESPLLMCRAALLDRAGELERAAADYQEAARLDPKNFEPLLQLSEIRRRRREYDAALAALDGAIARNESSSTAWAWRGNIRFLRGEFKAAEADFTRALELNPKYVWALETRARVRLRLGLNREAVEDATRAIDLEPKSDDAWNTRGVARQNLGQLDQAVADYDGALRINPENSYAWSNRSRARRLRRDVAGALADAEECVRRFPQFAPGWFSRGQVRAEQGDLRAAAADFAAGVKLDPGDAWAWDTLAFYRWKTGQYDQAFEDVKKALELDDRAASAYNTRGLIRGSRGDSRGAEEDYGRAIERDPTYFHAWTNRADLRRLQGHYDGALSDVNRALKLDPKSAVAFNIRGLVRAAQGDVQGALADYGESIRFAPSMIYPWGNRAALRQRLGDLDGAMADIGEYLRLEPASAWAMNLRGSLHYAAARYTRAEQDYSRAMELDGRDPAFAYNRGLARILTGNRQGALEDLRLALRLAPADWSLRGSAETEIRKLEAGPGK